MNIDGCRIAAHDAEEGRTRHGGGIVGNGTSYELPDFRAPMPAGRWPANLITDGSDEVLALFPQSKGQQGDIRGTEKSHTGGENANCYGEYGRVPFAKRGDSGSAARFFYCAKTSTKERNLGCENIENGNDHPTVKPVELMRYLCRLITPPNGLVIDPFMGSGSTGIAAILESFRFVGIEMDEKYIEIAKSRIGHAVTTGGKFYDKNTKRSTISKKEPDNSSEAAEQMSIFGSFGQDQKSE